MADAWIRGVVEAIHFTPTQAVLYLTGGASQVPGWLLSTPGASNTLLEAVVPYSRMSMVQLLGKIPSQFCSQQTADELAMLAYNRALKLSRPGYPVLGIAFTGSLATTRPKLGEHRFFMSTRTSDCFWKSTVTLSKGLRTREEEDKVSSQLLLKAPTNREERNRRQRPRVSVIANALQVYNLVGSSRDLQLSLIPALSTSDLVDADASDEFEEQFNEDQQLEQLISGEICFKVYPFLSDARMSSERKIILSGSFNPLHNGHLKLLEVAKSICGDGYPCFEISAVNADKPPLSVSQIKDRVKQFENVGKTVIISNQPYFYKKAQIFPGSAFVVGADTVVRLINPKYYDNDNKKMLEILTGCKKTGCTFLVGGRNVDGAFKVLEDFDIPEELKDMFISIPAESFRMDISSTEIRKRSGM